MWHGKQRHKAVLYYFLVPVLEAKPRKVPTGIFSSYYLSRNCSSQITIR